MSIFLDNFSWMGWNVFLGFLGVLFCYLTLKTENRFAKLMFFILWLLFIPNTIYILTDAEHFLPQYIKVNLFEKFLLIIQYLVLFILGVVTFIYSLYPFELRLNRALGKKDQGVSIILILLFNFVIAFAIGLGKFARTNSWDLIFNPGRAVSDILNLSASPLIVMFVLLFGLITNFVYFFLRKKIPRAF